MNKDYEIEDHWAVEIQERYRDIKEGTVSCSQSPYRLLQQRPADRRSFR